MGPLYLIIVDWNMWLPTSLVYKVCLSLRLGTSMPNFDFFFFSWCGLHMTSSNSFHLHRELKIQGLIQVKKCEVFTPAAHALLIFALPQAKSNCIKNFYNAWCYFHPLLCVLGTSQNSSIPLLQKWTTMKRNTCSEFQWRNERVFPPGTVPEQSMKKHVHRAYKYC